MEKSTHSWAIEVDVAQVNVIDVIGTNLTNIHHTPIFSEFRQNKLPKKYDLCGTLNVSDQFGSSIL